MARVEAAHPRIWATPDTLEQFRGLSQTTGKKIFDARMAAVQANLNAPLPAEPTFPFPPGSPETAEVVAAMQKLQRDSDALVERMFSAAFVYLITGSPEIGNDAVRQLMNIASWDVNGATGFRTHSQVHRYLTFRSAMAYDWLNELLTDEQKQTVQEMIKVRTETMMTELMESYPIYRYPYNSHGWTILGFLGIISTAMLHDIPEAAEWYEKVVPLYINVLPPWGGEDGSWAQGTGYWTFSTMNNKEFVEVLRSSGAFDLYQKAFSRNEGMYPLYMFPNGSPKGVFGDENQHTPAGVSVSVLGRLAQVYGDERLNWASQAIGANPNENLINYFYGDPSLGTKLPVDLPKAKWFQDTGLVAMHSELYDPGRVSLYFRSSPYGTYNHSHSDNNSFILNAFGQGLAIKAGYEEYYFSDHHKHFTKQTVSANAITVDGRKGQLFDSIDADGKVLGFVTHTDFDATSGDATPAYGGNVGKAQRHILYIRPSVFVVIDDLKSATPGGSEFEWRLHAEDLMQVDADQAGATIIKGDAALKVKLHAPAGLRSTFENKYIGVNGDEVLPTVGSVFRSDEQHHAAFITPKTTGAKYVTTMEPYRRDSEPSQVVSENHGSYMKLIFEDGTNVFVRMTDSGEVDAGSIRFDGAAVAVKGDTILLVQGTKVVKDGVERIRSTEPATIVFGKEQLSISGAYDTQVSLHAPGIARVRDGKDGLDLPRGGSAAANVALRGAHWDAAGDTLTVQVTPGQRAFKLNDKPMPGEAAPVTLNVEIDGVPSQVSLPAYTDVDGNLVASGQLNNPAGFYEVVEAPAGFIFSKYGSIKSGLLEANISVVLKGSGGVLKLRKVAASSESVLWEDPEFKRSALELNEIEAESYWAWGGGKQASRYTTRPFLSGGVGMGNWDLAGQWVKWTLNVPKAGKYDLVLKYVAGWDLTPPADTDTSRYAQLGNKLHFLKAPKTVDFGSKPEYWRGLRVKLDQQLPAGPVDLTMWADRGGMNLDWIGLIEVKEDEVLPTAPGNLRLAAPVDETVPLAWDASADNVAVKEYAIYVNGTKHSVVPATQLSTVVTGLEPGVSYTLTVRAVDTSDNVSVPSNAVQVTTGDTTAPTWGETASFRTVGFPNVIRLSWDPAADNSGKVASYVLYRVTGDVKTPVATVTGTEYDLLGLQPNTAYTVQVEARDSTGNESATGPMVAVKLPATATNSGFFDTFDDWAEGNVVTGKGWEYYNPPGFSTVKAVPLSDLGGKGLQGTDSHYDPANEYVYAPVMARTTAPLSGKVTIETRTKFTRIAPYNVGNPEIEIFGEGKPFIRFTGFSDGGIGYQKTVNGTTTRYRIPSGSGGYTYPVDEWFTLRFDIDLTTQTYGITMQADSLKHYTGPVDGAATLDKERGIYRVDGLTFYNVTAPVNSVNRFNFRHARYMGIHTFDYVTMYNTNAQQAVSLAAPSSVTELVEFPVTVGARNAAGARFQETI
ncbi:MAG TPA: DUF4962 domain-containing protein, partial [Paenibacillus sp.]|nr:DUF4962 domain-containing protein [Paenibacillus sp.]